MAAAAHRAALVTMASLMLGTALDSRSIDARPGVVPTLEVPEHPFAWDPPRLVRGWYQPFGEPPAIGAAVVSCSGRNATYYTFREAYGRLNNFLSELSSLAAFVATRADAGEDARMLLPRAFTHHFGEHLDYRGAFDSWLCVADASDEARLEREGRRIARLETKRLFYARTPASELFFGTLSAQLLLRPSRALRAAVDSFIERHLQGGRAAYVGAHLRWVEKACVERLVLPLGEACGSADVSHLIYPTREPIWRPADVCQLSTEYVQGWLERAALPPSTPLVLAHDPHDFPASSPTIARLKQRFNVLLPSSLVPRPSAAPPSVLVDMLLLIRSRLFLGTPPSTLSATVAAVREAMLGTRSWSNMDAAWAALYRKSSNASARAGCRRAADGAAADAAATPAEAPAAKVAKPAKATTASKAAAVAPMRMAQRAPINSPRSSASAVGSPGTAQQSTTSGLAALFSGGSWLWPWRGR